MVLPLAEATGASLANTVADVLGGQTSGVAGSERNATIRSTINWSHDLLSIPERTLYRRLSVFVGGFNLEGAEDVCGLEHPLSLEACSGLAGLAVVLGRSEQVVIWGWKALELSGDNPPPGVQFGSAIYGGMDPKLLTEAIDKLRAIKADSVSLEAHLRIHLTAHRRRLDPAAAVEEIREHLEWAKSTGVQTVVAYATVVLPENLTWAGVACEAESVAAGVGAVWFETHESVVELFTQVLKTARDNGSSHQQWTAIETIPHFFAAEGRLRGAAIPVGGRPSRTSSGSTMEHRPGPPTWIEFPTTCSRRPVASLPTWTWATSWRCHWRHSVRCKTAEPEVVTRFFEALETRRGASGRFPGHGRAAWYCRVSRNGSGSSPTSRHDRSHPFPRAHSLRKAVGRVRTQVLHVEDLGFDVVAVPDHFCDWANPRAPWLDCWALMAALAVETSMIRLSTNVSQIPLRNPGVFAHQAVTVDHISDGRVELGVGEYIEMPGLLLSWDVTTYEGEYYSADQAVMNPSSLQSPRIPLGAAALGPRMMRYAALFADGWNTMSFSPDFDEQLTELSERNARMDDLCAEIGRSSRACADHITPGALPDRSWVGCESGCGP